MDGFKHIVWNGDSSVADADPTIVGFAKTPNKAVPSAFNDNVGLEGRTSTWGRHTGLYDGTGYGDEIGLIPPHPSMSAEETPKILDLIAPKPRERRSDSMFVAGPAEPVHALHIAEAAGDHETLAEVIRAYAAYDEGSTSAFIDKDSVCDARKDAEDGMVSTMEAVDRSDRVMDASLGA